MLTGSRPVTNRVGQRLGCDRVPQSAGAMVHLMVRAVACAFPKVEYEWNMWHAASRSLACYHATVHPLTFAGRSYTVHTLTTRALSSL